MSGENVRLHRADRIIDAPVPEGSGSPTAITRRNRRDTVAGRSGAATMVDDCLLDKRLD